MASVLQAGTSLKAELAKGACLVLIILVSTTCRTAKKSADDAENGEDGSRTANSNQAATDGFPHPRSATAWETNALILTTDLPAAKDLNDCETEVTALAKEATNDAGILQTEEALQKAISANVKLYHVCFYWMARNLDVRTNVFGLSLDERSILFFQGMRSLWALSRALDQVRQVQIYFPYIRSRYLEMSADMFGRPLEVITQPLGDRDAPPKAVGPGKVAGPAEDEL